MKIKIPLTCTIEVEDGMSESDLQEILDKAELAEVLVDELNMSDEVNDMFMDSLQEQLPADLIAVKFTSPLVKKEV